MADMNAIVYLSQYPLFKLSFLPPTICCRRYVVSCLFGFCLKYLALGPSKQQKTPPLFEQKFNKTNNSDNNNNNIWLQWSGQSLRATKGKCELFAIK